MGETSQFRSRQNRQCCNKEAVMGGPPQRGRRVRRRRFFHDRGRAVAQFSNWPSSKADKSRGIQILPPAACVRGRQLRSAGGLREHHEGTGKNRPILTRCGGDEKLGRR